MSTETSATERLERWLLDGHGRSVDHAVAYGFSLHSIRLKQEWKGDGPTLDAAIHAVLDAAGADR